MSNMFKSIRVWWMYWRYRNITQRRQRFQMWMNRRSWPTIQRPAPAPYRTRGIAASPVYYRRTGRAWVPIMVMVVCLTVLATYGYRTGWNNSILHGVGALIFFGGVYAAMRIG